MLIRNRSSTMTEGGVKLQWSKTAKKTAVVQVQEAAEADRRESVRGISGRGLVLEHEKVVEVKKQLVIPKVPDTFEVGGGKQRYLPPKGEDEGDKDNFVKAEPEAASTGVVWGLNVRARSKVKDESNGTANVSAKGESSQRAYERPNKKEELDLESHPDEATEEAYLEMPVEFFGTALLRGMGWVEGKAPGRQEREDVKATEYVRRPQGLGLGAKPQEAEKPTKGGKGGREGKKQRPDLVYLDDSGRQRNVAPLGAKLVERPKEGVLPGKKMKVSSGPHAGLEVEVLALEPEIEGRSRKATVRFVVSDVRQSVRCKDLVEMWEVVEEEKESSHKKHHKSKKDRKRDRDRGEEERYHSDRGGSKRAKSESEEEEEDPLPPWLAPNIRVRIVDKKLQGGKLYLKTGRILDVQEPTVCDLSIEGTNQRVQRVKQRQLESVVPKAAGGRVKVILGKHRGELATLMQRHRTGSVAAVQLIHDLSILRVEFDEIAEYVGGDDEGSD